jgi:hypothetical protein
LGNAVAAVGKPVARSRRAVFPNPAILMALGGTTKRMKGTPGTAGTAGR